MVVRRRLRFVIAAAIALTGCNALLDVKDIHLDPEAGSPDGSNEGSSVSPEGSTTGEGGDAGPCNANVQVDDKNCGRCGHDCLGGACSAGKCEPVVLVANLGNPSGLAVGPDDVYFTTYHSKTVQSVKKSGGALASLATEQVRARGVAVHANTLYWANGDFTFDDAGYYGGIWQCTLPGCTARKYVAAGTYDTAYPTIRGAFLYFGTGEDDTIARVPLAGGAATVVTSNINRPFGIAVDDTHVYYTSNMTSAYRAPVGGGAAEPVGPTDGPETGFIAVDDQRVYWAYSDGNGEGRVASVAKASLSSGIVLYGTAQDNVRPVGIAVDADNVYWSTAGSGPDNAPAGDGRVLTCKKAGCGGTPPVVLATGNVFAGQLVVDDAAVYWAEFGSPQSVTGRIRKVAKP